MKKHAVIGAFVLLVWLMAGCKDTSFGGKASTNGDKDGPPKIVPKTEEAKRRVNTSDSGDAGKDPNDPSLPENNPILKQCAKQTEAAKDKPNAEVKAFAEEVESCLKEKKMYDFSADTCRDLDRPERFECNWESVIDRFEALGMMTQEISKASKEYVLLACAESSDGKRVMTQSIQKNQLKSVDCGNPESISAGLLTTCYTRYKDLRDRPNTNSQQDQVAEVARCLREESN